MMRLNECLSELTEETKQHMEQEQGGRAPDEWLTEHALQQAYDRMDAIEREVLQYFVLVKGFDLLTFRELDRGEGSISDSSFRLALTKLRRKGYVYTLRRAWGEVAFMLPRDVFRAWLWFFLKRNMRPEDGCCDRANVTHEAKRSVVWDVFFLLVHIRENTIGWTRKHTIHKRSLKRMMRLPRMSGRLHVEAFPADTFKHDQTYEPWEGLLLDLLTKFELITVRHETLALCEENVAAWLDYKRARHEETILDWFQEYYLQGSMSVRLAYETMLFLRDEQRGPWMDVKPIMQLPLFYRHESYPSLENEIRDKVLLPLWNLGVIELGENEKGGTVWRWLEEEEEVASASFFVQPSLEVLVPSYLPLQTHWNVSLLAELDRPDSMFVYALSKEHVQARLDEGWTEERMLAILEENAPEVPQSIRESLYYWKERYQKISYADVRVLICSDRQTADDIEQLHALASYLTERIGERHFVVDADRWLELNDHLRRHGYAVSEKLQTFDSDAETAQVTESSASVRLFEGTDEPGFKVENVFPDEWDAIPGLRRLPRLWTRHFQRYHRSTLKELSEKAAQMQLEMKIAYDTETEVIQPENVVNRHGEWLLETADRSFSLERIEKAQILIPSLK